MELGESKLAGPSYHKIDMSAKTTKKIWHVTHGHKRVNYVCPLFGPIEKSSFCTSVTRCMKLKNLSEHA
jgi:hypothetical protein